MPFVSDTYFKWLHFQFFRFVYPGSVYFHTWLNKTLLAYVPPFKIVLQMLETEYAIYRPRSVPMEKNCALGLDYGHSFCLKGPPGRQIT